MLGAVFGQKPGKNLVCEATDSLTGKLPTDAEKAWPYRGFFL